MSARTLERIKLGIDPQTGQVFIYRHGSNPGIALEKRSAFQDLFMCYIGLMMFGAEKNHREEEISIGGRRYRISATMLEDLKPETPAEPAAAEASGNKV
jgi:hypothetical protein